MTAPDAPTAMTLEEALVLADKKGVDVHFLNAPLRVVGERVAIHDGTEDGYPFYGGTWPEAFSVWLDRPVVERDPTAELVEALAAVLGLDWEHYILSDDVAERREEANRVVEAAETTLARHRGEP